MIEFEQGFGKLILRRDKKPSLVIPLEEEIILRMFEMEERLKKLTNVVKTCLYNEKDCFYALDWEENEAVRKAIDEYGLC